MIDRDTLNLSACFRCGRSYDDDGAVQYLRKVMGTAVQEPQALVCPRCGGIAEVCLDGRITIPSPEFIHRSYQTPVFVVVYSRMLSEIRVRIGRN